MDNELLLTLHQKFEDYVHQEEDIEFWYARELQKLLEYDRWENFEKVIGKAKVSCKSSGQDISDHFRDVTKMVRVGSGAERSIMDIKLTRYACYLIAQNGDPSKDAIAFAQTYFAVQTRKQEIIEKKLAELERLRARTKLSQSEKELSGILFERGVDGQGFARIRSKGDQALFGGKTTQDMKQKLQVANNRALADFLPTVTIKAKDLANEITSHNVKHNNKLREETPISKEHVKNNHNMREMLGKSGIVPEQLPPEEDLKKIQRRVESQSKKIAKDNKKLKN